MRRSHSAATQRGQWTVIGTLLALAILLTLGYVAARRMAARHSAPGEAATPTERALDVGCAEYASQMNQAVALYKANHDDKPPASLDDLKKEGGVTDEQIHAPGCSFEMDPKTGAVRDVGGGRAAPGSGPAQTLPAGSPPPGRTPLTPGPAPTTVGPGGIKVPTSPGPSSPDAGAGENG